MRLHVLLCKYTNWSLEKGAWNMESHLLVCRHSAKITGNKIFQCLFSRRQNVFFTPTKNIQEITKKKQH